MIEQRPQNYFRFRTFVSYISSNCQSVCNNGVRIVSVALLVYYFISFQITVEMISIIQMQQIFFLTSIKLVDMVDHQIFKVFKASFLNQYLLIKV